MFDERREKRREECINEVSVKNCFLFLFFEPTLKPTLPKQLRAPQLQPPSPQETKPDALVYGNFIPVKNPDQSALPNPVYCKKKNC